MPLALLVIPDPEQPLPGNRILCLRGQPTTAAARQSRRPYENHAEGDPPPGA
ncbi:MAG: hypothetical protein M3442_15355 [Chloroflexota bacterium]|nr:hypothetical protein [Chloroflexota bacterium]